MSSYLVKNRDGIKSMAGGFHAPFGALVHDNQFPPTVIEAMLKEKAIEKIPEEKAIEYEVQNRVAKMPIDVVRAMLLAKKVQDTGFENADRELLTKALYDEAKPVKKAPAEGDGEVKAPLEQEKPKPKAKKEKADDKKV